MMVGVGFACASNAVAAHRSTSTSLVYHQKTHSSTCYVVTTEALWAPQHLTSTLPCCSYS